MRPSTIQTPDPVPGPDTPARYTQRDRILAAAVDAFIEHGYPASTIGHVVGKARVSRPTFYDFFEDKQSCLIAVLANIGNRALSHVTRELAQNAPAPACETAIGALVDFCHSDSKLAQVLINTSLTGGARAIEARYGTVTAIAKAIGDAQRDAPLDTIRPDVDAELLIGGLVRLLGSRMRQDLPVDPRTLSDLLAWIASYRAPARDHRWSTLQDHRAIVTGVVTDAPFGSAPVPPRTATHSVRLEYHRQRVLFATAGLACEQGVEATTLSQIAKRAGVGYRKFHSLFADKQAAFLALHETGYRRILMDTVSGYFSADSWPERIWAALEAGVQDIARNPTLAHVEIVEPYALGAPVAARMDDVLKIFTFFLGEGRAHVREPRRPPTDSVFAAIAATIFDTCYRECRCGDGSTLPRLIPQAAFLVLAPFLGHEQAISFIDSKLHPRD